MCALTGSQAGMHLSRMCFGAAHLPSHLDVYQDCTFAHLSWGAHYAIHSRASQPAWPSNRRSTFVFKNRKVTVPVAAR